MAFVSEYFDATLTAKLPASAVMLPVSDAAMADLLALLADEEDYTFLAIKSEQTYEVVKAHKSGGMVVLDRAQESTRDVLHPMGDCIAAISPLTLAVMKDIVCHYECCEGTCECEPVEIAEENISLNISRNVPWEGNIIFSGSWPITIIAKNAPSWMEVRQIGNTVFLSGTMTQYKDVNMDIIATNCNGTHATTKHIEVWFNI